MAIETSVPRSRRSLLAAAAGGVAALVAAALGRPVTTRAAAGDTMKLGEANNSGTAQTTLANAGTGAAFTLKTTNVSTGATGIFGWSSATGANATRGVYGRADGPNSNAVVGRNVGPTGTGAAVVAEGNNNAGLVATTTSVAAPAVRATATDSIGVEGTSTEGIGVLGQSSSSDGLYGFTSGAGRGVHGRSTSGYGVLGHSTSNIGVYGQSSGAGQGVYGKSATNQGVYGISDTGTGVYGDSLTGFAGYFAGMTHVNGALSKSSGSFKIDHPLDPARRYLSHSFVESPDMKNVYDGLVTLDAKGEATVKLPAYFETLNRDLRYQLTPLGAFSPLYVKARVSKGRFGIAGGSPGQEVCWQITGTRKDPWAEAHPIVVEEPKRGKERGTYLHPELHGQPATKGLDYRDRPRRELHQAAP